MAVKSGVTLFHRLVRTKALEALKTDSTENIHICFDYDFYFISWSHLRKLNLYADQPKVLLLEIDHGYTPNCIRFASASTFYFEVFSVSVPLGKDGIKDCGSHGSLGSTESILPQKVETLQNNALRIITFSDFNAHVSPLYKSLKILKLKDQIVLYNCLFVFDQLNQNIPKNFTNFFITRNNMCSITTRSAKKGKLYIPRVNYVRYGRQSFKQSCILSWNRMIDQFPNTDFTRILRNDLKKLITIYFLNNY